MGKAVLLLMLAAPLWAAPLPFPRPHPALEPGQYESLWNGHACELFLCPCGRMVYCRDDGTVAYEGWWRHCRASGELWGDVSGYKFRLSRDGDGWAGWESRDNPVPGTMRLRLFMKRRVN